MMERKDTATPEAGRSTRTLAVVIVLLLVVSVAARLSVMGNYHLEGIDRDTAGYIKVADNIASGAGWVNHSVRYLYALPDTIPFPDSYWSPLFPLMLAGMFRAAGTSFAAGQVVTLVFGALVPLVAFFLAGALTRSRAAAVCAGLIAAVHPTLITSSSRVMPEIVMIFLVALALALLLRSGGNGRRDVWLGVTLGLAYLLKYQNGALVVPVVVYYFLACPWREAMRRIATVGMVSLLVVSPWLVRNAMVFGDPFYAIVRTGIISYYPEFGNEARFVCMLDPPPAGLPYILHHLGEAKALMHTALYTVVTPFFREFSGSLLLIPFVALGIVTMGRGWRRWVPLGVFAAFLVLFFSVTLPLVRYVLVLLPVWIAFAAAGMGVVWSSFQRRPPVRMVGRVVVVVALAWVLGTQARHTWSVAQNTASEWTPGANYGVLEAQAVAGFVQAHTDPAEPVLAAETYHYALILDRGAVQIPFDEETLVYLRDRYRIRYLVTSTRDLERRLPSWTDSPPPWATLVYTVAADDIPRPEWNPTYAWVSEMRVYELRR
jgi:4-amino-4-deoxy-L-arabinose transferase-like glycosyltransferase